MRRLVAVSTPLGYPVPAHEPVQRRFDERSLRGVHPGLGQENPFATRVLLLRAVLGSKAIAKPNLCIHRDRPKRVPDLAEGLEIPLSVTDRNDLRVSWRRSDGCFRTDA